ncbi:type II toxin-antitoxin system HicA family toxin [Komagataeibacter melaceti]|uniref:Type II toxin-antitoxin system HicA family toxin n=1 Tax=Komagataeibacter melaceti TaxID=2766577 RepID=A0A371YW14_9PROT|nr:type II toxin-antitoxin system HicA family toxin [Komagataeibacter melaceti]RFD18432.1 type II toxin-antitoxin system HicA family toxin [Komagataeibacter melaceti]
MTIADGGACWKLDRVRGSYSVFKHPSRPGIMVVSHPRKDLGTRVIAAICKQTRA